MNALVVTSCNRIGQVLLACALNARVIRGEYALIVVDGSDPTQDYAEARSAWAADPHNRTEPTPQNWANDPALLRHALARHAGRGPARVLHLGPRPDKQRGDAELTGLGLMAAAQLGCAVAVKLTGVSTLRFDALADAEDWLAGGRWDVLATVRHRQEETCSTRVFACRPEAFLRSGICTQPDWLGDGYFEDRFRRGLHGVPTCWAWHPTEATLLQDSGCSGGPAPGAYRRELAPLARELAGTDPYVDAFLAGGLWP